MLRDTLEWISIAVSGLFWVGSLLDRRWLDSILDIAVAVLPLAILTVLQLVARVDLVAGWWGAHSAWKLAPAAALLASFPVFGHLYLRRVSRRWVQAAGYILLASLWVAAVGMVVSGWVQFPHPHQGQPPPGWTLEWVQLHPTPAIHHLYANASYLGFYVLAIIVTLLGRPAARWLARCVGNKLVADAVSGVLLAASVASKVAF